MGLFAVLDQNGKDRNFYFRAILNRRDWSPVNAINGMTWLNRSGFTLIAVCEVNKTGVSCENFYDSGDSYFDTIFNLTHNKDNKNYIFRNSSFTCPFKYYSL